MRLAAALAAGIALLAGGCERRGAGSTASPGGTHSVPARTPPLVTAARSAPDPTDWCRGHGLPESMCTKCNPELIEEFEAAGDWCAEHGFPESACPQCNPQRPPPSAGAASADWCVEHGLPESKCPKCNPALGARFRAAGDWCAAHGFPESACPACNPDQPPPGAEQAAIEARVVRLTPPSLEDDVGIRTALARRAEATGTVACTGRIAFDADRVADVRTIVSGIVRRVLVELGSSVEAGAPLFELESTRVGELQASLQTARQRVRTTRANLARKRELREANIASARELEVAKQEHAAARAEVRSAEAWLTLAGADKEAPAGRYTLTAPLAGVIVRRPGVLGVLATEDTSLATIADTSVMWALCDVPAVDVSRVALGRRMRVSVEGGHGPTREGEITWIAPEVDLRTRTVTVRAELANPNGGLRANQFARGQIATGTPRSAVSVPRAAVQRVGEREVVFVRAAPGVYQPRVVLRHGDGELVQVEGGVSEGDPVVTVGAVLLRTEIMPGSIGAGCCEVEAPGSD